MGDPTPNPVPSHRELKESFAWLVDQRLPDLAYNLAFSAFRSLVDFGYRPKNPHHKHGRAGRYVNIYRRADYNQAFTKITKSRDGKPSFRYRPVQHVYNTDEQDEAFIEFFNFRIDEEDIIGYDISSSADLSPTGAPVSKTYRLENARDVPYEEEFETEDSHERQKESSFGDIVSTEFETSIEGSAEIIGIDTKIQETIRNRAEQHSDQRWTETSNHRDLLRGKHKVKAWGYYDLVITDQPTEISQRVLVTGRLKCSVAIKGDMDREAVVWDELEEMYDSLRGFGGGSYIGDLFGGAGQGLPETTVEHLESYAPIVTLDLGAKDERNFFVKKHLDEGALPGYEDQYADALAAASNADGGDPFDDNFDDL